MTPKELLEILVEHGCLVNGPGGMNTVAAARMDGGRFSWTIMFPVDQHHVHSLPYDEVRNHHDRDLGFYRGDRLVAYVAPYEEWPELDIGEFLDIRGRWNAEQAVLENRERFERFFVSAVNDLEA